MLVALRSFGLAMRSFGGTGIQQGLIALLVTGSLLQEMFFRLSGPSIMVVQKTFRRSFEKQNFEAYLRVQRVVREAPTIINSITHINQYIKLPNNCPPNGT